MLISYLNHIVYPNSVKILAHGPSVIKEQMSY